MRTASRRPALQGRPALPALLAALLMQACGPEPTAIERACDGQDVLESTQCMTAVSDYCRAQTTVSDCQSERPIQVNGVERFCQWTRVAPLTDEATCSFGPSFGRCEAGWCPSFCDGVIPDACTDDGELLPNNHIVFWESKEMVDLVGSGDGRMSWPQGPWSGENPSPEAKTLGWCGADGVTTPVPSWCSCAAQACAAVAQ